MASKEAKRFESNCKKHFANSEALITCISEEKDALIKIRQRLQSRAGKIETAIENPIKDLDSEVQRLKLELVQVGQIRLSLLKAIRDLVSQKISEIPQNQRLNDKNSFSHRLTEDYLPQLK